MFKSRAKSVLIFILGMLTFAVGYFLVATFIIVEKPSKDGIIEDWEQICLWQDVDGIYLAVSPSGCYSTSCTLIKQQTGTATLDLQNQEIYLDTRSVLLETSHFPFPCAENCFGGDHVQFKFNQLIPNDYALWFSEQKVGEVKIFSGMSTPRQCFENQLNLKKR